MYLVENEVEVPIATGNRDLLSHLVDALKFRLVGDVSPVRLVITSSDLDRYHCEVGTLVGMEKSGLDSPESIMVFSRRDIERTEKFNAALLVPTGIGAEIGGHAGDAMPVARLMAEACDTLITHPTAVETRSRDFDAQTEGDSDQSSGTR